MPKHWGVGVLLAGLISAHVYASPERDLPPEYSSDKTQVLDEYSYDYDDDDLEVILEDSPSMLQNVKAKTSDWLPSTDTLLDYEAIKTYIQTKYQKITNEDAEHISKSLVEYGEKNNVDPKIAAALIARESAFNKEAVSVTGAKGLGQIKDFNFKQLSISDPHDITQNVSGTTQYLSFLINKWKEGVEAQQQAGTEKMSTTFKNHNPELMKKAESSETEKMKLALASYYKGFTAVNKEGVDDKTNKYVSDIMNLYEEIKGSKEKLMTEVRKSKTGKDSEK